VKDMLSIRSMDQPSPQIVESPLDRARRQAGGSVGLGRSLGISSQAVSQWKRVPAERVLDVERASGVSRQELRPDLYPASEVFAIGASGAAALMRLVLIAQPRGHLKLR
jgi:DNA-binding transcriptional regulator YdaS (Cro superfamily)